MTDWKITTYPDTSTTYYWPYYQSCGCGNCNRPTAEEIRTIIESVFFDMLDDDAEKAVKISILKKQLKELGVKI